MADPRSAQPTFTPSLSRTLKYRLVDEHHNGGGVRTPVPTPPTPVPTVPSVVDHDYSFIAVDGVPKMHLQPRPSLQWSQSMSFTHTLWAACRPPGPLGMHSRVSMCARTRHTMPLTPSREMTLRAMLRVEHTRAWSAANGPTCPRSPIHVHACLCMRWGDGLLVRGGGRRRCGGGAAARWRCSSAVAVQQRGGTGGGMAQGPKHA